MSGFFCTKLKSERKWAILEVVATTTTKGGYTLGPLFLVLHLAISNVNAVDGNGMYEMCGTDRFGCFMYIFGYIDGAHQYGREFCFPSTTEPEQLRKVIWHYLNTHPSDRDQPAGALIRIAIDDAWPCEGDDNNWNKE